MFSCTSPQALTNCLRMASKAIKPANKIPTAKTHISGLATSIEKPGVAWALTKSTTLNLDQLISNLKDLDSRHWISFIIGTHGEERYIAEIEKLKKKDPEVYFAVTLLWKLMTSWTHDLKEY